MHPDFARALSSETLDRLADREVVVVAEDAPEPNAWLRSVGASAVIVRPDRYILGAVQSTQELRQLATTV